MPKEPILQQIQTLSCPGGTGEELRGSSLEALIPKVPSESGSGTSEKLLPSECCHTRSGAQAPNPEVGVHPPGAASSVHVSDRQEVGWKGFSKRIPGKREIDILGEKGTFQLHFIAIMTTSRHSRNPNQPNPWSTNPNLTSSGCSGAQKSAADFM